MTNQNANVPSKWATSDDRSFFPRSLEKEHKVLPPGIYDIRSSMTGPFFKKRKPIDMSELIRFDDTQIDEAVFEIQEFWKKKNLFERHNFPFRRGILLYGPPGSGKTCAIKMIMEDVVAMGGIAVMFCDPDTFETGMDFFRDIQLDTPVVVVMEDIDSWTASGYEAAITNMLDGHGSFNNTVFLATTNYIENLSDRIKNRPSRFDKRIHIGSPNEVTRLAYLDKLVKRSEEFKDLPIVDWAKASKGLTFAHLKELYLSVCFFGSDYIETISRLNDMIGEAKEEGDLMALAKSAMKKQRRRRSTALANLAEYDEEEDDDDDDDEFEAMAMPAPEAPSNGGMKRY